MISFRYHIVSIVSVFLALAIGVTLGGGPLKGEVDNTLVTQVQSDRAAKLRLKSQIVALRDGNAFDDSFAATAATTLLKKSLRGRAVTIVVLPTANQAAVGELSALVRQASGDVTGTVRIGKKMVDVSDKQLVDELGRQLEGSTNKITIPADASPYERMGTLVARAIGTTKDSGQRVDNTAASILSGLSAAELMSAEGDFTRRGSLTLVVAGPGEGSAQQMQGTNTIVVTLLKAMDAETDGTVVVGPTSASRPDGVIKAVRDDVVAARDVSTVDSLARTSGMVVGVLALGEQATGGAGQYGAVDPANGAMPGAEAR